LGGKKEKDPGKAWSHEILIETGGTGLRGFGVNHKGFKRKKLLKGEIDGRIIQRDRAKGERKVLAILLGKKAKKKKKSTINIVKQKFRENLKQPRRSETLNQRSKRNHIPSLADRVFVKGR